VADGPDLEKEIKPILQRFGVDTLWQEDGALDATAFDKFSENVSKFFSLNAGIQALPGVSADNKFMSRDIEPLLEQASALLDRALLDRAALQSVGEKWANLMLDLVRTHRLADIAEREKVAGRYTTPAEVSKRQRDAQTQFSQELKGAAQKRNASVDRLLGPEQGAQSSRLGSLEYIQLSAPAGPDPIGW
jgi:hypothetical protein